MDVEPKISICLERADAELKISICPDSAQIGIRTTKRPDPDLRESVLGGRMRN